MIIVDAEAYMQSVILDGIENWQCLVCSKEPLLTKILVYLSNFIPKKQQWFLFFLGFKIKKLSQNDYQLLNSLITSGKEIC